MSTVPAIRIEPDLIEAVVMADIFERASAGDFSLTRAYRGLTEPLYKQVPPDEREAAFEEAYRELFERLEYPRHVAQVWAEFPELEARAPALLMLKARQASEEGAVIGRDGRSVCLRVWPSRFMEQQRLATYVRHELQHACDMLEPEFGYHVTRELSYSLTNRVAEGYHVLWCAYVDARLAARGHAPLADRAGHRTAFDRTFPGLLAADRAELFARVWERHQPNNASPLVHADLVLIAREHGGGKTSGQVPGALCPLCRFPTHDWAAEIEPATADLIRADFPAWQAVQGACERCVECYQLGVAA